MNSKKIINIVVLLLAIIGSIVYLNAQKVSRGTGAQNTEVKTVANVADTKEKVKKYPPAKEITTPDGFINTPLTPDGSATPVTIGEFIGKKVVLLDIWTYSCINCQRTTPYLNAWYKKYEDKGLVIIGLHTPEFEFEKVLNNVTEATKRLGIKYPVVLDNDYSTWNAYGNRFWPRKYLIDIDGYIVYDHIGEGGYEETEKRIQEALQERGEKLGTHDVIPQTILTQGEVNAVKAGDVGSPEVYFGSARNSLLLNGTSGTAGIQTFTRPKTFSLNRLNLAGTWNIKNEFAENTMSDARIIFRYKAQYVHMVASAEKEVRAKILVDGKIIETPGKDVDENGFVTIQQDQLYTLVAGMNSEEHTLEIIIENPGLRVFTFTFG
ncbi:MAG: redoxin family protein [Candidatus Yonathbacteria bacterium]|nr:redoxin family protein [Candidatus Yonathbacteria bacterium]